MTINTQGYLRDMNSNSDGIVERKPLKLDMSKQEVNELSFKVDSYNAQLKESQKIVSKNTMQEADFMKLLITQLKTQDPTKPMKDKEFIGQMAQFTSLKQMNEMTDNMKTLTREFSFTKAVSLVNKSISWTDASGTSNRGIVESIRVRNGEAFVNVNGREVSLKDIEEISSGDNNALSDDEELMR